MQGCMKRIIIPTFALLLSLATAAVAAPRYAQPPADPPRAEPTRAQVRAALAARRAQQLARLKAYRDAGVFPRNRVSPSVINVFRDENGLLCAVANLVFLDGDLELVARTARDNNYVKMGELTKGPLYNWILASGFTSAEIAAIQLPDSPVVIGDIDWEKVENQRIVAHLDQVMRSLQLATDKALDLATDRLIAAGLGATAVEYASRVRRAASL